VVLERDAHCLPRVVVIVPAHQGRNTYLGSRQKLRLFARYQCRRAYRSMLIKSVTVSIPTTECVTELNKGAERISAMPARARPTNNTRARVSGRLYRCALHLLSASTDRFAAWRKRPCGLGAPCQTR